MYQLTALYSHPEDPAAFDKHYREVHAVLAAKLPGLQKFTVNWPAPGRGHVRLNFATPRPVLEELVRRLGDAVRR